MSRSDSDLTFKHSAFMRFIESFVVLTLGCIVAFTILVFRVLAFVQDEPTKYMESRCVDPTGHYEWVCPDD